MKESINYLKKSPVFTMSLGSKELFHSNLWAWIIDQDFGKEFIRTFFPIIELNDFNEVKREDNKRDLVIYTTNSGEFVIENKIKSYANREQLIEYSGIGNFSKGVVTGINEPPFELPKNWRFVSYKDVAKGLDNIIKNCDEINNIYEKKLLEDYKETLLAIDKSLNITLEGTKGKLSYEGKNIEMLEDIRMDDVFKKLKADDFVLYSEEMVNIINERIKGLDEWVCKVYRGFNNKSATITFAIERNIDNKYAGQIGVQLEGKQFRIFLTYAPNKSKGVNNIYKYGCEKLEWFDSTYNKDSNQKIFGNETRMTKEYCKYWDRMVYQYFNIDNPEKNLEDYEEIKKEVMDYLGRAVDIVLNLKPQLFD